MARRATFSPDKAAVIDAATGSTFSYRRLNERATRLANFREFKAATASQCFR
jgi:non-ribosomal peptide synthetase component E (peptide arylation enzyme)